MIIKIDTREFDLISNIKSMIINKLAYKDLEVKIETLPIGDVIINDGKNDLLIIERKSVNDLLASIKDGRYEEQSLRLKNSLFHNHNIIYLIEGDIMKINRFKDNQLDKITCYSAIFSLNYYKGFSVLRTLSIEESALFICNSTYKLQKGIMDKKISFYNNFDAINLNRSDKTSVTEHIENKLGNNEIMINKMEDNNLKDTSIDFENNYVNVIKKVKKENITIENIGEIMLCQIPGVSSVTALAVMNYYKTIKCLIEELSKNPNCLENITYKNKSGNIRKLNKSCTKNIYIYLINKMNTE